MMGDCAVPETSVHRNYTSNKQFLFHMKQIITELKWTSSIYHSLLWKYILWPPSVILGSNWKELKISTKLLGHVCFISLIFNYHHFFCLILITLQNLGFSYSGECGKDRSISLKGIKLVQGKISWFGSNKQSSGLQYLLNIMKDGFACTTNYGLESSVQRKIHKNSKHVILSTSKATR